MILLDIKNYIRQRQQVELSHLCTRFQRDSDTMRAMLAHWLRQGVVKCESTPSGCGRRCGDCDPSELAVYYWQG